MSWLASLVGKLLPGLVVDATTRLVQAARESLRPKPAAVDAPAPPIGESGAREASEYFRGHNDAVWKRHMDEHNAGSAERLANALDNDEARAEGIEQALDEGEVPVDDEPTCAVCGEPRSAMAHSATENDGRAHHRFDPSAGGKP